MGELSLDSPHVIDCSKVHRGVSQLLCIPICGICFMVIPRSHIGRFCFGFVL